MLPKVLEKFLGTPNLERMSFAAMIKLLSYNLEVMGSNLSNLGHSFFAYWDKIVYIYPPQTPLGGSLVYWATPVSFTI